VLVDEDVERPRAPWSLRLVGLAVVIVVAWVVLFPLLNIAASLLALALYVIIAFVAYQIGKAVGRATSD
jgi:Flp pilus assembly protein protease CpaA